MNPPVETSNPETLYSIELTNGAQALRDLYFQDGRGSVFTYKKTRGPLRLTALAVLFCTIYYFLSVASNQISYIVTFTIASVITFLILLWFLWNARTYFKWKKGVDETIKRADSFKKVRLNLKAGGFEAIYDDEVAIEKWSNFNRATISPTHIYLHQPGADYLFPASSMQPTEYEALAQLVRSNVAGEEGHSNK